MVGFRVRTEDPRMPRAGVFVTADPNSAMEEIAAELQNALNERAYGVTISVTLEEET